eukprot:403336131
MQSYLKDSEIQVFTLLYYFCLLIGFWMLMRVIYGFLYFLHKQCIRRKLDLYKRYADPNIKEGSWVVVTGSSDGIGAEYCRQLAQEGFNIVLISRTLTKLKSVEQECLILNPNIKTKILQKDFSGETSVKFYEDIYAQIKELDIAMLINNAGVMNNGTFLETDFEKIKATIDVDVLHVNQMCSRFLPKLINRKQKAALINVASQIGLMDGCSGTITYSGAKSYVINFTEALAVEVGDKLDVQCLIPNLTKTNLLLDISAQQIFALTPQSCVKGSLRDIGHGEVTTSGDWKHDFMVPFIWHSSKLRIFQMLTYHTFGNFIKGELDKITLTKTKNS